MLAQDPPPPPLLAPAAALLQRLAPYGLTVPQAWLQPRIVLLDVGARTNPCPPLLKVRVPPFMSLTIALIRKCGRRCVTHSISFCVHLTPVPGN